jgi:SAM-dependent methyltransferase
VVPPERDWYHTIDLGHGRITPGYFDLRDLAPAVLPPSLAGARCLDVATFDGFWAIEMARRGAAEVVAVDILDPRQWDWPPGSDAAVVDAVGARKRAGDGFAIATQALGLSIERHELSVYELGSAGLETFDFVYVGSLLLHLRDPVRAIAQVAAVCGGRAVFVDAIDSLLTRLHPRRPIAALDGVGRPWWWRPNLAGLARMVTVGGFELTSKPRSVLLKAGAGFPRRVPAPAALRHREVRADLRNAYLGDPHGVIEGRPRA